MIFYVQMVKVIEDGELIEKDNQRIEKGFGFFTKSYKAFIFQQFRLFSKHEKDFYVEELLWKEAIYKVKKIKI